MRIGELAEQAGVKPHTVRYYEREGLLRAPRRTQSGYRDYGPEALDDLRFIKKAQAVGLALEDVREVMAIASGGKPPCDHVRAAVRARLGELEQRLRELGALRLTLLRTLRRLERAPRPKRGCRCAVIEEVAARTSS
ncbi:MAG: MerR family transcriptional regulator [Gemmatimonadetes bacterium]|nr:MerR family transcriptional regulator [Gemmatimonadota bacterium]